MNVTAADPVTDPATDRGAGTADTATKVSVVVPVRDDADGAARCVTALLAQTHTPLEIVVVDNGSVAPLAGVLPTDPRLRVIVEERPGSYAARNAGLAVATGEVVAFTDADCVPSPDWIERAVAALRRRPRADVVGGAIRLTYARGEPSSGPEWYEHEHAFRQDETVARRGYAVTANLVTWRAVVDRVGRFDATVRSGADARWCRAVSAAGGVLRYAPDAVVDHPARRTWRELIGKHRRTTQGVVTRLQGEGRGQLYLLRLVLGHLAGAAAVSLAVWRRPVPRRSVDRVRYVAAYWAVSLTVTRVLVGALRGRSR